MAAYGDAAESVRVSSKLSYVPLTAAISGKATLLSVLVAVTGAQFASDTAVRPWRALVKTLTGSAVLAMYKFHVLWLSMA